MAENEKSRKMHPAEQVTGFRKMAEQGFTPAQIGDLFGFTARHVQRILSLANLIKRLVKLLNKTGDMPCFGNTAEIVTSFMAKPQPKI